MLSSLVFYLLWALHLSLGAEVEVINQWPLLDFEIPYNFPIRGFVPENNVFTGMEVGYNRIFLAIPRLRSGVPATLAWIPRSTTSGSSPQLRPYPNWDFHNPAANCSGLISVYRIRADNCERLWVMDSGVMTSLEDFTPVCPPKLMVFDMRTDTLLRVVTFPRNVLRPNSLLTNLILDESGFSCDDTAVYITDTANPGLVVYDSRKDAAWRFTHPSMWPEPDRSSYTVGGESFTLMDGIIGLALSHSDQGLPDFRSLAKPEKVLYFQALASDRIYSVSTSVLRNGPLPERSMLPVTLLGKKSSQGAALSVDSRDGSIIFSPVAETAIASWSPTTGINRVIAYDPQKLQFVTDISFSKRDGGNMWLMSTRLQKLFNRSFSPREINFRIIRIIPDIQNSLLL